MINVKPKELAGQPFYVLVVEGDTSLMKRLQASESYDGTLRLDGGPMVWETYLKNASLDNIVKHCKAIGEKYGQCVVAKCVIMTEDEVKDELPLSHPFKTTFRI